VPPTSPSEKAGDLVEKRWVQVRKAGIVRRDRQEETHYGAVSAVTRIANARNLFLTERRALRS